VSIAVGDVPEVGNVVRVRDRLWVVSDATRSELPDETFREPQYLLNLTSVEDDGFGDTLRVIWEIEPGREVLRAATLPRPITDRLDAPQQLDAFIDAVRSGAIASADPHALQAPFRSGITIEDYQLDPVVRSLRVPRVNLLIADDVGLGKTIEAGLLVQELLLRHRARTVLVVCPASLTIKWRSEMAEKFGLEFRIVDQDLLRELRRERGITANPWTHFPRLIVSMDWLKRPRPMALFDDILPLSPATYPRPFDLLIIDEVHNVAPAGRGKYATDSQRTRAIRRLAPYFEHRVFLSATPHNGYTESFTALLELLDPQRFARGVKPPEQALWEAMVRRLKTEIPPGPDGRARFPTRTVDVLEVAHSDDEHEGYAALSQYAALRAQSTKGMPTQQVSDFVTLLLKKRLFSSPAAFAETLNVHRRTLTGTEDAAASNVQSVQLAFGRLEDDLADESEIAQATEDALRAAAQAQTQVSAEELRLLERLEGWARRASARPDAKAEALFAYLERTCRTKGPDGQLAWNDERVIVFTEYRDTQIWLEKLLAARGLGGERLQLLFGGIDRDRRERIRAEFQADPSLSPVRILLATDAASEGIDLQRSCHRVVHYEIPFSPTRLEQRNGRVDRHGQPAAEVLVFHFVPKGWQDAAPGTLEGDLQFLRRVAIKVDTIRIDLGSVGSVLQEQLEEAMLGRRATLDDEAIDRPRRRAVAGIAGLQRNLREEIDRLRLRLTESREELGVSPAAVERVVQVALELARQPALRPTMVSRPFAEAVEAFSVPNFGEPWSRAIRGLEHPVTGWQRPITFSHDTAAEHDDVVLAHLGHPLVALATRLLRAEIWRSDADTKMSRVTARWTYDASLDEPAVVAHARLVVTSAEGHRLHEELITAGGRVRRGRFSRMNVSEIKDALTGATEDAAGEAALDVIGSWDAVEPSLQAAIEQRGRDVAESIQRRLEERMLEDANRVRSVLTELANRIQEQLRSVERGVQLELFDSVERDQFERDVASLRRRLDEIPHEIEREVAAIVRRYADPVPRVFPAAITILVPAPAGAIR
jgi:superfamily II DNA or RNA helicase